MNLKENQKEIILSKYDLHHVVNKIYMDHEQVFLNLLQLKIMINVVSANSSVAAHRKKQVLNAKINILYYD